MSISVLISVYYKEKAVNLKQSLDSIFNQTLMPIEVVLVQDGPLSEELYTLISLYKKQFPKILKTLVLSQNFGLGYALRTGAEVCKGDFIARMDSDDIARPYRFEKQYDFLLNNPNIGVVGSNLEEFNQTPGDLGRLKINPETHEEITKAIKLKSPFNHPSIMMRKAALFNAGNYDNNFILFEDYSLFLRMWKAGVKFYNIQEALLDFRVGSGIETIKRRSGIHYLKKEKKFVNYAISIGAFSKLEAVRYKLIRLPVRLLPSKLVLFIYNTFLRKSI